MAVEPLSYKTFYKRYAIAGASKQWVSVGTPSGNLAPAETVYTPPVTDTLLTISGDYLQTISGEDLLPIS